MIRCLFFFFLFQLLACQEKENIEQHKHITLFSNQCALDKCTASQKSSILVSSLNSNEEDTFIDEETILNLFQYGVEVLVVHNDFQVYSLDSKRLVKDLCSPVLTYKDSKTIYVHPLYKTLSEFEKDMPERGDLGRVCVDPFGSLVSLSGEYENLLEIFSQKSESLSLVKDARYLPVKAGKAQPSSPKTVAKTPENKNDNIDPKDSLRNETPQGSDREVEIGSALKVDNLSDKDFGSFIEKTVYSEPKELFKLEKEIAARLYKKNLVNLAESRSVFNQKGVEALVSSYKGLYPEMQNMDIQVVDRSQLQDTIIQTIQDGKSGQKSYIMYDSKQHFSLLYVDHDSKNIYFSDTIGIQEKSNQESFKFFQNLQKGVDSEYKVFAHDARRQNDQESCSIFCLHDLRSLKTTDFVDNLRGNDVAGTVVKGADSETPASEDWRTWTLDNQVAQVVPADLFITTQSLSRMQANQKIGEFLKEHSKKGSSIEDVYKEYSEDFVNQPNTTYIKAFYEGYFGHLRVLYEDPKLQSLYFISQKDVDDLKQEDGEQNLTILKMRSLLTARILQGYEPLERP